MVQRADAAEAQDRRDLCVFILEENELKSNLIFRFRFTPQNNKEVKTLRSRARRI